MPSITHQDHAELRARTNQALQAVQTAMIRPSFGVSQWRGAGDWSSLDREARQDAGRDALEHLADVVTAAEAARDALEAELVAAGVAPGQDLRPSAEYPAAAWAGLEGEGHWSTPPQTLARLVVSDLAAEVADTAFGVVSVERKTYRGDLIDRAAGVANLADELLTAAVVAERESGTGWTEIDEALVGARRGWELPRRAEDRYAAAYAGWLRGLDEPRWYPKEGGLGSTSLPDAALRPRTTAGRLDAWVVAHRQPHDRGGQGDTPVSAATVDAPIDGLLASCWNMSVLSASSRSIFRYDTGSVVRRVFAERKVASSAAMAAAAPEDKRVAELAETDRARLAELRDEVQAAAAAAPAGDQ